MIRLWPGRELRRITSLDLNTNASRSSMDFQDSIAQLVASKRILVLGSSGSGKTALARRLGQILRIDPIHLDAWFWRPGWVGTPQSEWREVVGSLVRKEAWIMDGTYESTLDLRLPAADSLIMLEQPRRTCLWRVLKRRMTVDDHQRPDAPAGQKLDAAFLRYIWRYPDVTRPYVYKTIEEYGRDKPLIALVGDNDIKRFIRQLEQWPTGF